MNRQQADAHTSQTPSEVLRIPAVDLQHMEVLALLDDIAIAAEIGVPRLDIEKAVATLLSRIGADLFAEEYLMYAADYPALSEQLRAHRRFVSELSQADSAFDCGEDSGLYRLLECVHEWVCEHAEMDRQLETYLRAARH